MKEYFPILEWLPNLSKKSIQNDFVAGLTVGIMLVPQGMAYALLAGLPPVFGLYAALVPQVIYAIMGTSRQLSVGPVAMDSLLVASGLAALKLSGINEYISMAIFLAFFMGLIQLVLGFLRMGFLVNFLSKPVISGFTSAAAIIIGLSQLKHLVGAPFESSNKIHLLLIEFIDKSSQIHLITLFIGLIAIAILVLLKKLNPSIPGALIAVILSSVWIKYFGENSGVSIVGVVPEGLPSFRLPEIELINITKILPLALTLALIAFMEAISVAKAIEEKKDYSINPNQELIALGASNIVGSLFQSYPTTGGFSRTAVNDQAGANSGLASIISAIVVGLTLLFLTPLFYFLPNTILASIIMVAVFKLIDFESPKKLWKSSKSEFYILLFTFFITLFIGIKEGIILGVLASLLLLVYRSTQPHVAVLGKIKGTDYFKDIDRFTQDIETYESLLLLRFDEQIYFGNSQFFKEQLLERVNQKKGKLSVVILSSGGINYIDSSGMKILNEIVLTLKSKNIQFYIAGAIGPVVDSLFKSGVAKAIGSQHFFANTQQAFAYFKNKNPKNKIEEKISLQANTEILE
ncbi:MAG: SulP family sulfate permease [Candidatus Marivariicella framensis]|jgi:SulP family sulfate permease|tara:strand:+ start:1101 stop:2828 length:1728 start_codon:yes stop_codon:yes gene_type:complete